MASGTMMARLGFAALVSGGAAGLVATLALFFLGLLFGAPGGWWGFAMLGDWLPVGLLAGIAVGSFPAFFAGASMWALGDAHALARRPLAWAAAGMAVGGAVWTLFALLLGHASANGLDSFEAALLAAGLTGGAGGALAFLGTMRKTGPGHPRPGLQ